MRWLSATAETATNVTATHPSRKTTIVAAAHQAIKPSWLPAPGNTSTICSAVPESGLPEMPLSTSTFSGHGLISSTPTTSNGATRAITSVAGCFAASQPTSAASRLSPACAPSGGNAHRVVGSAQSASPIGACWQACVPAPLRRQFAHLARQSRGRQPRQLSSDER